MNRVSQGAANQCQATTSLGQCTFEATSNGFCRSHCGGDKKQLRNYRLQGAILERGNALLQNGNLKDLSEEIILLRVALNGVLDKVGEDTDNLLLYTDKIQSLVASVRGTVESLQKLEEKNKELLDRGTLFSIMDNVVQIIMTYVSDPDTLGKLAGEIYELIAKRVTSEDEREAVSK